MINRGLTEAAATIKGLHTPNAKALQERAVQLTQKLKTWTRHAPTRFERTAMVSSMLELKLDALRERRERK